MRYGKPLLLVLLLCVFCAAPIFSLTPSEIETLQTLLLKYKTLSDDLKVKISDLEMQLKTSERLSEELASGLTGLEEELKSSREALQTLEDQYANLETLYRQYLATFQESKEQTKNSLKSLQTSLDSLQIQNKILGAGSVISILVGAAAVVVLILQK